MIYDFTAPLFWYKLVFVGELVLSEGLAFYTLRKKERFALRVVISLLSIFVIAFLFPIFAYNALYSSFIFLMLFMVSLFAIKFCFDEPWSHIVFCGVVAYTTQHIAYETFNYLCVMFDAGNLVAVYDSEEVLSINGFTVLIYVAVYSLIYWFMWAFIERKIRKNEEIKLENTRMLLITSLIILVDIVLNSLTVYDVRATFTNTTHSVIFLYSIVSCALSLNLQFSMLAQKNAENELKEVQELWRQDKRMYELSKQNVELINIKCHDLKHQIGLLSQSGSDITREALKEIEKAVNFYDGAVSTGNDVLDLIMAEKSLYCTERNIRLTCIADGAKLNFISIVDLYSLLENAVRNAIEAVEKYDDPEKKFVRIKVMAKQKILTIHVENYIEDASTLVIVDGLPQTTKGDADYHGYGMKSMRMVAEKYGGALSVNVEDKNLFELNIMIPLTA